MKKKHEIIMLPSDVRMRKVKGEGLTFEENWLFYNDVPQHLYILSDESIKKEDLFINLGNHNTISKATQDGNPLAKDYCKKIIGTTDPKLIKDGVAPIHNDIIKAYVKNLFDKVEVEYVRQTNKGEWKDVLLPSEWGDSNPIKPKVNQDGTLAVTIPSVEESKERKVFEWLSKKDYLSDDIDVLYKEWIKENL